MITNWDRVMFVWWWYLWFR